MLTVDSLFQEQKVCLPLTGLTLEDKPEDIRTSPRLLNYSAREIKDRGICGTVLTILGGGTLEFAKKGIRRNFDHSH